MIRLVHPWNGHAPETELPDIGRGAARLLVERGLAVFIDPNEKLPERPKLKVEKEVERDEPNDEVIETQREEPAGEPAVKRRGRKKTT